MGNTYGRPSTMPNLPHGLEKPVMVIGVDDSTHSFYALEWTLDHFFADSNNMFWLIIVYARPIPSAVIGLAGPGAAEVLPLTEMDSKRVADRVVHNAKELCNTKSVKDVSVEVAEGDAWKVMYEVVDKYHTSVLVVGSHGYGPVQRAFLGSVSDHCARHAHCSRSPRSKSEETPLLSNIKTPTIQ